MLNSELKPNTICKNKYCTHGKDGGRKHYYSCHYCVHTENWRSMACCPECYEAYLQQVKEARSHHENTDTLPDRTDMTKQEVEALIKSADTGEVFEQTVKELKEIFDAGQATTIDGAVDVVNKRIEQGE